MVRYSESEWEAREVHGPRLRAFLPAHEDDRPPGVSGGRRQSSARANHLLLYESRWRRLAGQVVGPIMEIAPRTEHHSRATGSAGFRRTSKREACRRKAARAGSPQGSSFTDSVPVVGGGTSCWWPLRFAPSVGSSPGLISPIMLLKSLFRDSRVESSGGHLPAVALMSSSRNDST
jgi:hypothetical protein